MYDILILRGKAKGQVWFFDFANDVGVFPLKNPKTNEIFNFLDWYELYLDSGISFLQGNSETCVNSYLEFVDNPY